MDSNSPMKAFTYMFDDNKFWQKFLTIFFITLLPTVLMTLNVDYSNQNNPFANATPLFIPMILISMILFSTVLGYSFSCISSLNSQKNLFILPMYSFGKNLISALKYCLAAFIFMPFFWLIIGIIILVSGLFSIISPALSTLILAILYIAFYVLFIYYIPAFMRYFAITQKITSFYHFKNIFASINYDKKHYLKYVMHMFIFMLCNGIFQILISIPLAIQTPTKTTLCIYGIIISGIMAYSFMAMAFLFAKCVNEPEQIEENVQ